MTMNEDLIGREIWVEMDEDKSATVFSPRKGVVVHLFASPPGNADSGCQIDSACFSFLSSAAPHGENSSSIQVPRKGELGENLPEREFLRRCAGTETQKGSGEGFAL